MTSHTVGAEVLLARVGVSGLQIRNIDAAATALLRFGLSLLVVDESDDRQDIAIRQREARHARVRTSVANHGSNLVAAHVGSDQFGAGEIRAIFTAGGIAAVAERAMLNEQRSAIHLDSLRPRERNAG